MHITNFHSFLALLTCLLSLSQALSVPLDRRDTLAARKAVNNAGLTDTGVFESLERRILGLGKKKKTTAPTKPTTTPVQTPTTTSIPVTSTPASTTSLSTATSTSSSVSSSSTSSTLSSTSSTTSSSLTGSNTISTTGSLTSSSSSLSTSSGSSSSSSTSSTTSGAARGAATKAVNICKIKPSLCQDDDSINAKGGSLLGSVSKRESGATPVFLTKRERRSFTVDFDAQNTLEFKALDYPSSGSLFGTQQREKSILNSYFNTATDGMQDFTVAALKVPNPVDGNKQVTEHIVELQTIKAFITAATSGKLQSGKTAQTPKIPVSFFMNSWTKTISPANLKKMSLFMDGVKIRDTPNDRVFEAMGSTTNPSDFVLCEKNINSFKEHFWSFKNAMQITDLHGYVEETLKGSDSTGQDSATALSVIRTSLSVFSYLNKGDIKMRIQETIEHVRFELAQIEKVFPTASGLAAMWDEFIADYLTKVETFSKTWITTEVKYMLKEYQAEVVELTKSIAKLTPAQKTTSPDIAKKARLDKDVLTLQFFQKQLSIVKVPPPS